MYTLFTIESHLNNCVSLNREFDQLQSIWNLNKKNIPNAQSAISFNFPHYSLHENSHSSTIIKNIESFLGKERIEQLSPTDAWLILMAAYTHDLGMVVFNNVLEKKWADTEFQEYLLTTSNISTDKDLRKAAKLLLVKSEKEEKEVKYPLEIRKAVVLVTADYYRKIHHNRSREILSGVDEEFYRYINGFNLTGIPNRFSNVLAEIAYGHGTDFYTVIDRIEYEADGYGNDKMHPRFVAFLLRLGDLLDVDDKRFNSFNGKVFDDKLPHSSQLHQEKHASVKHLLISPNSIEITVDCKSDEVYRIAREWFDWLQKEVEDQSREWTNIAPKDLLGIPPVISRGKIKVLYKSVQPKEDLMNLRFEISSKKVFEMFEGSAIYERAGVVFIRELIQNALDATKIQIWKQLFDGLFDQVLRKHLNVLDELSHDELIRLIKFPSDMPETIWEGFQILLNIYWKDNNTLRFEVSDNGTGISEDNLIRMTKKVGQSRSVDQSYQTFKSNIPYWLKPTGAFGIGLQSLFLVTDSFTIQTKVDSEEFKEINFVSAKNGEYCKITDNKINRNRGTKVVVDIDATKLPDIFGSDFLSDLDDSYDLFDNKYESLYLYKLVAYLQHEFSNVDALNIVVLGSFVKNSKFAEADYINRSKSDILFKGEKVFVKFNDLDGVVFNAFENIILGSELKIYFNDSLNEKNIDETFHNKYKTNGSRNNLVYLVRDIPVDEKVNFYYLRYCKILWNLDSQDSDKLLNISRSKFIKKEKNRIDSLLFDEILPEIMQKIVDLYENNVKDKVNIFEYFNLHLTAVIFNCHVNNMDFYYKESEFPSSLMLDRNLNGVKFKDFFSARKILIFKEESPFFFNPNKTLSEAFKEFKVAEEEDFDIVIWQDSYLMPYMYKSGFYIVGYYAYEDDVVVSEEFKSVADGNEKVVYQALIYEKNSNYNPVKCNNIGNSIILSKLNASSIGDRTRRSILPLEKYHKILSINSESSKFYHSYYGYSHYIISPFNGPENILKIKDDIILNDIREDDNIVSLIKEKYLSVLVTDTLVNFVIEHSPFGRIESKDVYDAYANLIKDYIRYGYHDHTISIGNY